MSRAYQIGGRYTLAQSLAAFLDGEELAPEERHELRETAEMILAHAAHGWPENGPRLLEDAYVHFRPEDFTA